MPRRMWVGCLTLLVVVSGGMARGAYLTQTAHWSGNGETVFNQFDPTLGTLSQVHLSAQFTRMDLSFVIENSSGDAQTFGATYTTMMNLGITGVPAMSSVAGVTFPKLAPRELSIGANETKSYGPYAVGLDGLPPNDRLWTYTDVAAALAAMTGTGTLTVGVGGPVGTVMLSGFFPGGALTTISSLLDWDVEVTLNYTYSPSSPPPSPPVPEPSSLALAGMGIAGLVGAAWRRRRRVAG